MRNYYDFDTTPAGEDCAQMSTDHYDEYRRISRLEAGLMMKMINRHLKVPEGIGMKVAWQPHDFGSYSVIRVYYEEGDEKQERFMEQMEDLPDKWDPDLAIELENLKELINQ